MVLIWHKIENIDFVFSELHLCNVRGTSFDTRSTNSLIKWMVLNKSLTLFKTPLHVRPIFCADELVRRPEAFGCEQRRSSGRNTLQEYSRRSNAHCLQPQRTWASHRYHRKRSQLDIVYLRHSIRDRLSLLLTCLRFGARFRD